MTKSRSLITMSLSSTPAAPAVFKVAKSRPDNWSSNPLQAKSYFSIPFSSTTPAAGQFQTEACGLGWSFAGTYDSVRFERSEKVKKRRGRKGLRLTSQKRRCKVSLFMHPGAVTSMPSGGLHVKASVSEEMIEQTFQSPIELSELPLGDITRGDLDPHEAYSFDITVTLNVPTDSIPNLIAPRPAVESEIMEVVTASLDGEFPIDIKFVLFTRRSGKGRACHPRAVFATSRMLKGRGVFIDKYVTVESDGVDIDSDGISHEVCCDYPFEDDSDLESDGELEGSISGVADGVDGVHPSGDLPEEPDMIIDEATTTAVGYTYSSEPEGSVVECFADEALPDLKQTASPHETSGEFYQRMSAGNRTSDWNPGRPVRLGSVKPIKDVAYTTFKSLIGWIYTGKIAFKPLKSLRSLRRDPSACSPKSMYRLATRAGLDELRKLAFDNLRSQLTEENIIRELFSTFSRDNPEVLEMELTVILKYFSTTRVRAEWENMIDVVFDGGVPHGVIVIKRVTRRLASSEKR
ncbi:hypothetical protein ARMGADRAFT_1065939 [Armillaria gallica]|uniref:BTB domain-containing protein n=1 Tax=Armillaria gallica TaxID=47427 RepID=A0A2H3D0V7_ARMGA|nr:hypothetical protein ARMGADRAFT_1065939 [Armillaria gallica]